MESATERGTKWSEIGRLRDKGNFLTEDQTLQLLLGVCRGLEASHAQGYAHSNLRPTNTLPCLEMRGSRFEWTRVP